MLKIRLESRNGPDRRHIVTRTNAPDVSLGELLAEAVHMFQDPRDCQTSADMVIGLLDDGEDRDECWPGYNQALDDLLAAAHRIARGWAQYDQELDEAIARAKNGKPSEER